jgi:hypothetical protein
VGAIDWCGFTWEAFATLATGLAAVGAAVFIGTRQAEIQKVQAGIQSLALRSDLFDRRYRVYERTQKFVGIICRTGDAPDHDLDGQFLMAMGESKFLFDANVVSGLGEIWSNACSYAAIKGEMRRLDDKGAHIEPGLLQRERDLFSWFSDRLMSLPELFEAMKLG